MITMGKGRLRLGTLSIVVHDGKPFPAYMPPRALLSGNTGTSMEYFKATVRGVKDGVPGTLEVVTAERDSECVSKREREFEIGIYAQAEGVTITSESYRGDYVDKQPQGATWVPDEGAA